MVYPRQLSVGVPLLQRPSAEHTESICMWLEASWIAF